MKEIEDLMRDLSHEKLCELLAAVYTEFTRRGYSMACDSCGSESGYGITVERTP